MKIFVGIKHLAESDDLKESHFSVDTIISMQDVKVVAQRIFKDLNVTVLDYRLDAFSSEPLGYFGSHWQLSITVQVSI